jgi:cysteine/glycine-rich protein
MATKFGANPKCPRCSKAVYHAEKVLGAGKEWHRSCLTCMDCNKRLDSTTLTEHGEKIYCKACYARNYGPKGYGFAGGSAMMHTSGGFYQPEPKPDMPTKTNATSCPKCAKATDPGARFCPGCGHQLLN